jgi:hypothetical protein
MRHPSLRPLGAVARPAFHLHGVLPNPSLERTSTGMAAWRLWFIMHLAAKPFPAAQLKR